MTNSNPVQNLTNSKGDHQIPAVVAEFLSDESLEIVQHFGLETPKLLNDYANSLEDALIEQVKLNKALKETSDAATEVVSDLLALCLEHGIDAKAELAKASN